MIAELALFPLGQEHMSFAIAKAIEQLKTSGVNYRLGPMGSSVEGDSDKVFAAIQECFEAVAQDHARVVMTITMDN